MERFISEEKNIMMNNEIENMNWIIEGIRDSLQKMRDAKEEAEWDTVAQEDESWE
jgi:hypothetical protein